MNGIPRYAEPMCGWPHDVDLCDIHNIPYTVCDCVPGEEYAES